MLDRINARFRREPFTAAWSAGGALADAGLLLHIFDGWEINGNDYVAANTGMSTSIIYADMRPDCCPNLKIPTYTAWATGVQGIIFRPGPTTRIMCGTSTDSTNGKCKEWCPSVSLSDDYDPHHSPSAGGCRGSCKPEDFGPFLHRTNLYEKQVQSIWGRRYDYNEIVVDGEHWSNHLPHTIEAFFRSDDHGKARKNDEVARQQHLKFITEYGLSAEELPLLTFDPHNWHHPFS